MTTLFDRNMLFSPLTEKGGIFEEKRVCVYGGGRGDLHLNYIFIHLYLENDLFVWDKF